MSLRTCSNGHVGCDSEYPGSMCRSHLTELLTAKDLKVERVIAEVADLKSKLSASEGRVNRLEAENKGLRSHHITPAEIENELAAKDQIDGDPENKRLHIFRLQSRIKELEGELHAADLDLTEAQSRIKELGGMLAVFQETESKLRKQMMGDSQ